MRVVIEALAVIPFGGYAVGLEGLLRGWEQADTGDDLHLMLAEGVDLEVPGTVTVHRFGVGRPEAIRRVAVQSRGARKVCREVDADVLLGALPATTITPAGCPKVMMVYDLRHELLPEQFTPTRRLLRKVSYGIGYRQAAALTCISERTRRDLLRSRPWLGAKPVVSVPFAADHVDDWPVPDRGAEAEPYALAFGHFPNKGVNRVIDAWGLLSERGEARMLRIVGVPADGRDEALDRIRAAGLGSKIELLPWMPPGEFRGLFAAAGLIVFPSDFEGFGLPSVEAMRLGIPLVISDDEALLEVTGGNAEVAAGTDPPALAEAVASAWGTSSEDLERARAWTDRFSWKRTALETRSLLADVAGRS